jgi:XTP/dITP diphosphohydrolase
VKIDPSSNTLVLASGNPGKLAELTDLFGPLGFRLRPQSEWGISEAVEDAHTFIGNALIKARHAALHTGLPAIADDSGLVVPALGGAPGIHSARYAGPRCSDEENNRKLLDAMSHLTGPERVAFFHCTMVLMDSAGDPAPLVASANWDGEIAGSPRGAGGFGYDPIFWLPDRQCSSAELPLDEKNRLSHRGCAARTLAETLAAS